MKRLALALRIALLTTALPLVACTSEAVEGDDTDSRPDEITGATADIVPSTVAPEISLRDVVQELVREGREADVTAALDAAIGQRIAEPARGKLVEQLNSLLAAAKEGRPLPERFPVLPYSVLSSAQAIFATRDGVGAPSSAKTTLDLTKEIARQNPSECRPERPSLVASAGGFQQGGLPDPKLSDCALFRTQELARVLNDLSLGKAGRGSAIVDGTLRLDTVSAIVDYLVRTGHSVRVENNRYFADFLGLWYKGKSVAAPVWIDTGVALRGGGTLTLPAPHAGYSIHIRGKKIDGTLEFFLGTAGGTSFRAVNGMHRPRWAGERAEYSHSARNELDKVKETLGAASALRARWTLEGSGKALDGYGRLGVCTDSVSVIEQVVERKGPTLFPLARLERTSSPSTGELDGRVRDAVDALPHDIQDFNAANKDASTLRRIKSTMPFSDADLGKLYPTLADDLRRVP